MIRKKIERFDLWFHKEFTSSPNRKKSAPRRVEYQDCAKGRVVMIDPLALCSV